MGNCFRNDTGACIRDEAAGQKGWWAVCAASACKASYGGTRLGHITAWPVALKTVATTSHWASYGRRGAYSQLSPEGKGQLLPFSASL